MKTRQERMKKDYGMIGSSQGVSAHLVSLKMWTKTLSKCDMLLWLWEQIRSKASEKMKKQLKIIPSVFLVCCDGTLDVCLMREVYMCVSYEGYTCVSYERRGAQVPYCTNCTGIRVVGDLTHRLKCISSKVDRLKQRNTLDTIWSCSTAIYSTNPLTQSGWKCQVIFPSFAATMSKWVKSNEDRAKYAVVRPHLIFWWQKFPPWLQGGGG